MSRGFGYAVNYDKALEEDQREIDLCDRILAARLFAVEDDGQLPPVWSIAWTPERAARAGLTSHDCVALQARVEANTDAVMALSDAEYRDAYNAGGRIIDWLEAAYSEYLYSEAEVKKWRRRVVASRSRHRRNRERYGS